MLQNIFFYHKWIAGGNGTHGTHYYITRGRVGARKREKDAEERNNRNYSRITAKKKKATRKKILEKGGFDLGIKKWVELVSLRIENPKKE